MTRMKEAPLTNPTVFNKIVDVRPFAQVIPRRGFLTANEGIVHCVYEKKVR